jgi:hypothetical protein
MHIYAWRVCVLRHFIGGNIHVREYKQTHTHVFVVWIRAPQFELKIITAKIRSGPVKNDARDKCPPGQNKRTASMRISNSNRRSTNFQNLVHIRENFQNLVREAPRTNAYGPKKKID